MDKTDRQRPLAQIAAWFRSLKEKGKLPLVAAIVAFVVVCVYLVCNLGRCSQSTISSTLWGQDSTDELGAILSAIEGAGHTEVLVTYDKAGALVGVIVVSEGAANQQVVVKLLRAVQTATGADLDKIQGFVAGSG